MKTVKLFSAEALAHMEAGGRCRPINEQAQYYIAKGNITLLNDGVYSRSTIFMNAAYRMDVELLPILKIFIDRENSLVWETGEVEKMDWGQGITKARRLTEETGDDWRVPERWELIRACDQGGLAKDLFGSLGYWSPTALADSTSGAWSVYFSNGHVSNDSKAVGYCVRCVRNLKEGE